MIRARFAPSPTGYLHIGSARTFIFNWLFVRKHHGKMVLRIDDTDVDRNTEASLQSIYDGLNWLALGWDEFYRQSERLELHRKLAHGLLAKGLAYRDFTPAAADLDDRPHGEGPWLCNPEMRALSKEESDRRAAAGEPFVIRYRVQREPPREVAFTDGVYGPQSKLTADIEDFALLRSDGMPTYHMASCADDVDLRISHVIRGQDHLTNTFKHVLIFRALGLGEQPEGSRGAGQRSLPQFAHLPLLVAPDGAKLSKRKHGPVVSVTTYRDAGFLPEAFINFLCLLGWSPKNDRQFMNTEQLRELFSLEGINRANAVINFHEPPPTPDDEFDPKAVWLNAEHIRALPVEQLADRLVRYVTGAGFPVDASTMLKITPLIRERIRLLRDALTAADFFLNKELPPYDPALLIPQKGDAAMAGRG